MLRKRPQERLPERVDPGDSEPEYGCPGSIEQQLDMCEEGTLRGDEILFHHGRKPEPEGGDNYEPLDPDRMKENYHVDMAEENREGDEMSGDGHSSGLQGDEMELSNQIHIDTGLPGDWTQRHERVIQKKHFD
ncbi:MAG: hypothetical protein AABZ06_01950 [Bdellovibrionota bacterium]